MAYLYFAIVCLLFGSNFKLMDVAATALGPLTVGSARLLGGAAVLLGIVLVKRQSLAVDRKTLLRITIVAITANAYPFVIQPWILSQEADHSFLAIFVPLTPLMTIMAAVPMLGVRPTGKQTIGVAVGLVLLVWIALADAETHHFPQWLMPIAVTVPLSYAIGNTLVRQQLQQVPALVISSIQLAVGGTLLLPLAIWECLTMPTKGTPADLEHAVFALSILGPLGTGACIGLLVHLILERGPLFAGMTTYVIPLVALGWGYRDGEAISTLQLVAMGGILCMVALVQSSQANYVSAARTSR
ncbi:DMT family transporter [Aeoliella mucimassa]|uniref:S-adenosylmethionine/S-adenosylhomocysteine transporter n=1 Tax=Aeoliella mucimassa TaxID=2527972 RepID=A0A518AMD6_9BACT|nr:DMT family transporter [Aeoliella mucimassa]QDU55877.1 S-adenosylmethionine/S-adenosylhomocysteine transporter [Aeoliella mucimassa]